MALLDSLLIAAAAIVLWSLLLYVLQKRGLLERRGLAPSPPPAGPFLMWKTLRGRQLIDRLARPKRFWRVFGDIAIVLVALTMLGTTVLLAWEATLVQNAAIRSNPPSPETLLGLPGINPIIPLGYGILGLAVAIILHEFSHGILSRVANIKIRSLGLIFLIFPIGAFVEPDEDELRALPRRERGRLYAVGPATNVLLAVLFATQWNPTTKRALLGIYAFDVSTDYYHPLTNPDKFGGVTRAILAYISLPFSGYSPIDEPATHFYQIQGPAALIPASLFWLFANALYWLFWLNLMLGATNALPAVPLDGGYLFKDGIEGLVSRLRKGIPTEQRDRIVRGVSYTFAFLILGLVLWQLIGPRI